MADDIYQFSFTDDQLQRNVPANPDPQPVLGTISGNFTVDYTTKLVNGSINIVTTDGNRTVNFTNRSFNFEANQNFNIFSSRHSTTDEPPHALIYSLELKWSGMSPDHFNSVVYDLGDRKSYNSPTTVVPFAGVTTTPVCFRSGTMIRTAVGDVAVERLCVGDMVVTAAGAFRAVRWLGRRSYAGRFANANPDVLPVCFKAGSLSDNVPTRDLWVSPEHAMFLDGVLIPAEHLINDVSVIKATRVECIDYYHVELEDHDVLLAEGAPSESFVDDGGRNIFQNAHEYIALYPDALPAAEALYCAPRLEFGFELEAIRQRLLARAVQKIEAGFVAA